MISGLVSRSTNGFTQLNEGYKEAVRRRHRSVGHYLSVKACNLNLDCIVLSRRDLEGLFGLVRFKRSRVEWLKEDMKQWFPYPWPFLLRTTNEFDWIALSVSSAYN